MKKFIITTALAACILLSLLIFAGLKIVGQMDPDRELSPERIEEIWNDPDKVMFGDLNSACLTMASARDWERAAVFYWCSQVRLKYEQSIYPPDEKGGNNPLLLNFAIASMLGIEILPNLYSDPESHKAAVERFRSYVPRLAWWYFPFWSHDKGMTKSEAQANTRELIDAMADLSEDVLKLTEIPEYFESLKVWNDLDDTSGERPARLRAANDKMWMIEEKLGIKSGLAFPPREINQTKPATPISTAN